MEVMVVMVVIVVMVVMVVVVVGWCLGFIRNWARADRI